MVNICFSISAVIKVEYLDVCHIAYWYLHCASISRYYGLISIFLHVREQKTFLSAAITIRVIILVIIVLIPIL